MSRNNDLDLIKAVGIFLVVMVHTVMSLFMQVGRHWIFADVYASLARAGVPLFFMVSGALLFHKEHSLQGIFRRIMRLAIPLLFWSFIYLLWRNFQGESVRGWLKVIIREPVAGHLWFIYAIIGAYLVLPIMSQFYRTSPSKTIVYILAVWAVGAIVLPTASHAMNANYLGIQMDYISLYAGYMLLGAWLNKYCDNHRKTGNYGCAALIAGWFLTAASAWEHTRRLSAPTEFFFNYFTPNVAILSIGAFMVLKSAAKWRIFQKELPKTIILQLSTASFGIYLSHVLILFLLSKFGFGITPESIHWLVPYSLMVMLMSFVIVKAIQFVPLLRAVAPG